jgi:hypothetical protein
MRLALIGRLVPGYAQRNLLQPRCSRGSRNPGRFHHKITPNTIAITASTLGKLSVTKDIDAVLRKIEHWHQGSIAAFKIMYRDEHGVWNGIRWNAQRASFFSLCETDEKKAMAKLLRENAE